MSTFFEAVVARLKAQFDPVVMGPAFVTMLTNVVIGFLTFELRESIFKAFTDAGIQMPYETLKLAPIDVRTTPWSFEGAG